MHFASVSLLFLSSLLLLSPLSSSIHDSHSNMDSGFSLFEQSADGFQPPDSTDISGNFAEPPLPYQDDTSQSPQAGAPNYGDIGFSPPPPDNVLQGSPQLPDVPSPPINDASPPASDSSLPTSPQLPSATPPSTDNTLPTPQLSFIPPPPDNLLPPSYPQLPFTPSPPLYNTLPGSPHSPLAYHHPEGTPMESMAPSPFGGYPSGQNQVQPFGQTNNGPFGQQQGLNDVPIGSNGQFGGCSSIKVDRIGTALALIGVLLISWV